MASNDGSFVEKTITKFKDRVNIVRRAFQEFLAFPTLIIVSFLLLAIGVYIFERSQYQIYSPIHDFFKERVFADAQATSDLLSNVAGSIITVTSITITLLLLIVQQTASNMSSQVFDQFLRRRSNQFYFGFFVGVAVYTLITLATVREPFNPVFAASLVFFFTVLAMFMLLVLFYSTIHQMRPTVILSAIHGHTLDARENQMQFINRTRRESQFEGLMTCEVRAISHGFVTSIHLDSLNDLIQEEQQVHEVILLVSIGSFVSFQDRIAELKVSELNGAEDLLARVRGAVQLESTRDLASDPAYGIKQLENIAWTVLSPSKSNLASGLEAIYNLRDLLARWADEAGEPVDEAPLPIVYNDNVIGTLIHAFESLAVVTVLSREHQVLTEILISFSTLFARLPGSWQAEAEDAILRMLPTLEEHHLTADLERALEDLIRALELAERYATASQVRSAYARTKK